MKHPTAWTLCLFASLLLPACSDDGDNPDGSGGGETNGTGSLPTPTLVGAQGVTLKEISVYQSLKRQVMLDGAPTDSSLPLIQGRDTVVRVFYQVDESYKNNQITARLEITGAEPIEVKTTLSGSSTEENIASTINFSVPGAAIGASLDFKVSVLEEGLAATDNAAARYPAEGTAAVAVDGPLNTLRVAIAPFRYNYDGSGRLPDTSPETIEAHRARLKQIYPVSNVEISVLSPVNWPYQIDAFGAGWEEAIYEVYDIRNGPGIDPETYVYGMFNPRNSFGQYCSQGCLLGLTLLNDQPPTQGDQQLRFALGVGYLETAADTMAHEIGHAHGRSHANCGGADGVDPNYPHPGAQLGIWGLNTDTLEPIGPTTYADIMGYCDPSWVSDYTFTALLSRGTAVNAPKWQAAPKQHVAVVGADGKGRATFRGFSDVSRDLGGARLPARAVHLNGQHSEREARFVGFDHLPGGLAFVPVESEDLDSIELELDGVRHVATLPR